MGRACLGFAVGAFFIAHPRVSLAQVVVPPGSEVPIPPKPKTDSTAPRPDTLKAPFGRAVGPRTADIGPQYQWNREQIFASGAYTLADLLERVPGMTTFRTGWLASPKFAAVNGDLRKIKVFYDGVEMDNLDPRSGTMLDLTTIDLWPLENVSIERSPNETRIHLRSWRVDNTDPYTRTDVYTGDENTNIYRGFYGKRWQNGAGLQLGGQQFGTRSPRFGGGGDALSFIGRVGVAKKMWSVDAFGYSRNASRTLQPTFSTTGGLSLPPFQGTHSLAYFRTAIGNQNGGGWVQAIASYMSLGESSSHNNQGAAVTKHIRADTTDTTTKRVQYVFAGGYAAGLVRASATDRVRAFSGDVTHTPSARFEIGGNRGIVSVFAEHNGLTKRRLADAVFRVTPIPFLAFAGGASYESPDKDSVIGTSENLSSFIPKTTSARIEAGVKVLNPWLIAGLVTRDTAVLAPPTVVDSAYAYRAVGRRTGLYAGLRGTLYKDVNIDVIATRWDSAGFYQPRFQARSEINLDTRWIKRFPSGSFGVKFAAIYDYRGSVAFPTADGVRQANASGIATALLEIRILRGVASYQVRNPFGRLYQIVPDFYMPRSVGIYGLRWEFSN